MDWPLLIEFVRQRAPAFLAQLEGVPDASIWALAADRGAALPASYVEFLRRMGSHCSGWAPFGATLDHHFAAIVERLDAEDEDAPPSDRFFPVAIETDESLVALYDHYLDLQRVEGDDAPLVMLEAGVPYQWQTPIETHETFNERVTFSLFHRFQLRLCAERDVVTLGGTLRAGEGRAGLQQALVLLQRAGFEPALPLLGRTACLRAGTLSVLARVNENHELLTLLLGSDNRLSLKALADQLLAGLPGARRPSGPFVG
ncbi:SMI1/KNR4 family protein [Corallococcus aberystwythensis]|uniref:SMI1/KNR4 family protein n=1 Tax=Corallococcus aberystwythensis TaxID=2316722 RepID=A0A3A8QZG1_9BACT|nr:SMI1/KNR4 family protein [Corallococcus aberystwythensis]RKH73181.1 hypothetical protein D7W81_04680 [Corallococcus aberystwythensis]